MSSQSQNPPGYPVSMGPGARRMEPGAADPGSVLKEVGEIRSHYSVSTDQSTLSIGYDLKGATRQYNIPYENIPLGAFSRFLLYGGSGRTALSGTYLIDAIRGCENMTGQPLTQKEVEGFALHAGKRTLYTYNGLFASILTGAGLAYNGRKDMKFPFVKAKPQERYNNFPNRYTPILTGDNARRMWHITRTNIYIGVGLFLLYPLFGAMGDTSMMVGLYRDLRTKEVMTSMKGSFDRISSNRARNASGIQNNQAPPPQSQDSPQSEYDKNQQTFTRNYENSPTSGYGSTQDFGGDSTYTDASTDTGMMSDSAMRQQESRQPSPSSYNNRPQIPSQSPQQQQQPYPSSGGGGGKKDFFFDDASPTAGNDPDPRTSTSYSRPAPGAWDRVRRGVPNQRIPDPSPSPSPSSSSSSPRTQTGFGGTDRNETTGDSFAFSKTDEDKQLAKQQAQKEFDDMLDRERKNSGSGEYDRAMNATEAGREDSGVSAGNTGGESAWGRRRRG